MLQMNQKNRDRSEVKVDIVCGYLSGRRYSTSVIIDEYGVSYRTAIRYMRFLRNRFPDYCYDVLEDGVKVIWRPRYARH